MAYGGLVQHSVILIKYLRELGCEVLPLVGLAPPYNDEVSLENLGYTFDAFNVADYVLRDKPAVVRWLVGWYARHQVANGHPQKVKATPLGKVDIDVKRIFENLFFRPDHRDVKKVEKIRREFAPDIDYVCELSLAEYFGRFSDLNIPLVVPAQGYEISQRRGVDVISAIKRNEHRIDWVISGSQANVDENIARDLPFLLPRTRVIHYGIVDDDQYAMTDEEAHRRTARLVQENDDYVIVTLSRIEVEKGTDLALHALRILLNQGHKARLRVVGDAMLNDGFRSTILHKIAMMDLSDKVDLVGFVEDKADKAALLKTSDAFLAPFIKSEPFGLVFNEAMASSLPVLTPDNGAGSEIIHWNGYRAGMVYRSQDTGQMADAIRYLIEHPTEAKAMGADGRLAVSEHFNAKRMAEDIIALFAEAIEKRKLGSTTHHVISATNP
jgi:glycosyltransferase involved in cell wall biosynthesis